MRARNLAWMAALAAAACPLMAQTPPDAPSTSADSLPPVGYFYSSQSPTNAPAPGNFFNLPAWSVGNGEFLLDDVDYDYAAAMHPQGGARSGATMMMSGSALNGVYDSEPTPCTAGDPVYLTNVFTIPQSNGDFTVKLEVAGGQTNTFSYDLYSVESPRRTASSRIGPGCQRQVETCSDLCLLKPAARQFFP